MGGKTSEIRQIFGVLIAGVIAAFAIAAFFVLQYGPSGRYVASSVLLDPTVIEELNYNDYNPITGGDDRYIFDDVTFTDIDLKGRRALNIPAYKNFYQVVQGDTSLLNPEAGVEEAFKEIPFATLTIRVKTESPAAWQKDQKIFQEVQLEAKGNHYRIELHEANKGTHWVYFNHPDILSKLRKIIDL